MYIRYVYFRWISHDFPALAWFFHFIIEVIRFSGRIMNLAQNVSFRFVFGGELSLQITHTKKWWRRRRKKINQTILRHRRSCSILRSNFEFNSIWIRVHVLIDSPPLLLPQLVLSSTLRCTDWLLVSVCMYTKREICLRCHIYFTHNGNLRVTNQRHW